MVCCGNSGSGRWWHLACALPQRQRRLNQSPGRLWGRVDQPIWWWGWRMGQPLVGISTGDLPSSGSLESPPDCGNILETRTDSPTGKKLGHRPWRTGCSFAMSIGFDYPHFAKSEASVAPTLIIPATCRVAEGLKPCMKAKSLFQIIPALIISVAMATTTLAAGKVNP